VYNLANGTWFSSKSIIGGPGSEGSFRWSRNVPYGQTDRQSKVIVALLNFTNAPENDSFIQRISNLF
jgi:hypothetical protein